MNVTTTGTVATWGENPTVSYHPEEGACSAFSNSDMLTKFDTLMDLWADLTETDLTFLAVPERLTDIDSDNYQTYIYTASGTTTNDLTLADGFNVVAFDDDGEITAAIAGTANKFNVLGFASINIFSQSTGIISDGQAVINCRCVTGHPTLGNCTSGGSIITVSEDELDFTILHEMGHFLNLDHTQVNYELFTNSITSDDVDIPVMFPVSFEDDQITPRTDDKAALGALYPSTSFLAAKCLVTGTVTDSDGNALRCADIEAIAVDPADTVSYVSGSAAAAQDVNDDDDTVDSGECESGCGDFELYLDPSKTYTLTILPIDENLVGGSGVGPCINAQLETITEQTLATITGTECMAGGTLNLGTIITGSSGGTSSGGGGSGAGEVTGTGIEKTTEANNPIGYGCSLVVY